MSSRVVNTLENLVPTSGVTDQGKTVSNSVLSLVALHDNTTHVLVSVDTQSVRVTFDGSDPTTTNGHLWAAGYEQLFSKPAAAAMKFIRATGSDGYIHVTEFSH